MTYIEWLEIEVKRLNDENANIAHFFTYDELDLLYENKTIKAQCYNWEQEYYEVVDENDKQDEYIKQLQKENYKLQNDLFTEQLIQDEQDDYIDRLKNELFNAYLQKQNDKRLIEELKTALSSYNNFVDEMFPN